MSEPGASSTCVVRTPEPPAASPSRALAASSVPSGSAASRAELAAVSRPKDARGLAESVAAFLASVDANGKGREGGESDASSNGVNNAGEDAETPWEELVRLGTDEEPVVYGEERVVDLFGETADRASVRAQLLGFYEATNQLARPTGEGKADDVDASLATVTEMTLRVDTELELLRRKCFAERNARWDFATPDMFVFVPAVEPTWAPQPANHKLALLAGDGDAQNGKAAFSSHAASSAVAPPMLDGFPVSEYARDRPWPPKEFSVKPTIKPKSRGGKRKATPAAVVAAAAQAPVSIYPRMCVDCHTQSTPLWRKRVVKKTVTMPVVKPAEQALLLAGVAVGQLGATPLAPGAVPDAGGAQALTQITNGTATSQGVVAQQQKVEEHVDVCMQCYLKTERRDLFERKKAEKVRKERERRDRASALAAAEKKRLQQLKKQQKKQLKQQQQQDQLKKERAASIGATAVDDVDPIETALPTAPVVDNTSESPMVLKFTKDELEAALERNAAKKEKKRNHHEKKKKKKKKRKLEHFDDSDTDGLTPMPSPPQMARYEYADITHPGASEDLHLSAYEAPEMPMPEQPVEDSNTGRQASRSSRKRDGKSKSPGGSSSKKRRSVDSSAKPLAPVVMSPPPPVAVTSSSRPSRAKTVMAPTPTAKRKRARTKKESNRERELRALGQYCPMCNEVYEEDDDSSFVCCDSCEMWVHAACDPSLTPETVTALANPDEKYMCPLCAGR